ncbi:glycosyltransferase [Actinomyces gaoshouyii]|uniref:Glycosyl transferase family 1 n=1 Tax=Actinomyces gaoshouyii TaxID=1960083 RepID=A0A8H9LIV4_9ACTO|nr:glycosyltransferase [Actinomyces gaoshouyii]GGO98396.1 glycosyl transferase family 1 [Actinomyces gaoshouyii]
MTRTQPNGSPTATRSQPAMRIMLVTHGLGTGGAEMMVLNLARELKRSGHPVLVACLGSGDTDIADALRDAGVRVEALGKRKGPDPRATAGLRRLIHEFRPTVIHTHQPVLAYVLPAVRLSGARPRLIHTVHSVATHETRLPVLRRFNRYAFRHGVVPVALGEEVRDSICREYRLAPEGVPVVRNGVDVGAFACERDLDSPGPGARRRAPRLLCVARLAPVKNHALLLDAVAALVRAGRDASLTIVGDGPLVADLGQRARTLGIADRVRFAGPQRNPAPFYAEADIFALASEYEGLPMSVIEAMAAGLPVVATAVGGMPSIVADGLNGALINPRAPQAAQEIAAAVARIWEDPGRYSRLSRAALATARDHSARAMMEAYCDLYR